MQETVEYSTNCTVAVLSLLITLNNIKTRSVEVFPGPLPVVGNLAVDSRVVGSGAAAAPAHLGRGS